MGWRIRTVVHMQRSKNRGADGINLNLSPKALETGIPMYEARRRWKSSLRKRECSSSTFFNLFRLSTDWMVPTHLREGHLLFSVCPSYCSSLDFLGSPVVKTPPSKARAVGSNLVGKWRSQVLWGQNTKAWNRSNIVANSIKTFKKWSTSQKSLKKIEKNLNF